MLRRLWLQWFWDTYDSLGRLVVLNLLVFTVFFALGMLVFVPAFALVRQAFSSNPALGTLLGLVLFTVGGAVAMTVWFPGLLYFSWQVSQDREFGLKDFFKGLRLKGGRFLRFALLACFIMGLVAVNMAFYARDEVFGGGLRMVGAALAALCFWIEVMVLGVVTNAMPLVAREDRTLKTALKLGAFVTLRYPLYTFGAIGFLALLWFLSLVVLKTAPLWVIGLAATATYINSMHDAVVWWEGKREKEKKEAGAEEARAAQKPTSWKQIQEDEEAGEKPHDRYQRTLRDILKPWE